MFDRDTICHDTASFLWFASPEELRTFLLEVEPRIHHLLDDDLEEEQKEIAVSIPPFSADEPARGDELEKFNAVAWDWEVGWLGHFSDLLEARSHFAKMLAANFRGSDAPDADEAAPEEIRPIGGDEVEKFISFIHGEDVVSYWDVSVRAPE